MFRSREVSFWENFLFLEKEINKRYDRISCRKVHFSYSCHGKNMYFNAIVLFLRLVFNVRKQHVVREDPFFYHLRYNLSCEEIKCMNHRYSKSRQYVVVNTCKEYFDLILGIFSISYGIKERTCYLKKLFILIS